MIVAGAQQKVKNMFTEALTQEVKQKNQKEAMKAAVPDTKSSGAQVHLFSLFQTHQPTSI